MEQDENKDMQLQNKGERKKTHKTSELPGPLLSILNTIPLHLTT